MESKEIFREMTLFVDFLRRMQNLKNRKRQKGRGEVIPPNQLNYLITIEEIKREGGLPRPAEISRRLGKNPSGFSGMLNRMEANGLITRVKTLKKSTEVEITEKGRKVLEKTKKIEPNSLITTAFFCLSAKEKEQLENILQKLNNQIEMVTELWL